MDYWGLATLQPFGASMAIENLLRQEHQHYYPRFLEQKIKRGKKITDEIALLPGYIFVMITDRWMSIKHTKGIASIVMCGSLPSRMREAEIDRIKATEAENGFVVLPERKGLFSIGQKVRHASFGESIGIYQGDSKADRTRVLFSMFGRSASVFVRERDLEAVA